MQALIVKHQNQLRILELNGRVSELNDALSKIGTKPSYTC